jgi:hypothetical protein
MRKAIINHALSRRQTVRSPAGKAVSTRLTNLLRCVKAGFTGFLMADDPEAEKKWDEYDWERFLQQQDRRTEQYMELLEKYIDDPNRDQIIAREMGWAHFAEDEPDNDWFEDAEADFTEAFSTAGNDEDAVAASEAMNRLERHPLYTAALELTLWLDELFTSHSELTNHPLAIQLTTQTAIASAKLAAALSDHEVDELGMTIAYLKRALKAATTALNAAHQLEVKTVITREQGIVLRRRLFYIRDAIVELMGTYRAEWRRRYGGSC